MRNTYALLIAGDEERFVDAALEFKKYLIDQAKFNPIKIFQVYAQEDNYDVCNTVEKCFTTAEEDATNNQVVIAYNGHGTKVGISPTKEGKNSIISYFELGMRLRALKREFLFVNDCCYSESVIPVFESFKLLPHKGAVIASAAINELSYGNLFSKQLLDSVRQKRPFDKSRLAFIEKVNLSIYGGSNNSGISTYKDENETVEVIENLDFKETKVTKFIPLIQHPQRCGLSLDHLLFPQ